MIARIPAPCRRTTSTACSPSTAVSTAKPMDSTMATQGCRTMASSSTMRMVPLPVLSGAASALPEDAPSAGAAAPSGASTAGISTRIVAPFSAALSTRIAPRWPRTIPSTAAMPSPRPVNFVVKNGSNIRFCVCSSIPQPLSATSK